MTNNISTKTTENRTTRVTYSAPACLVSTFKVEQDLLGLSEQSPGLGQTGEETEC